MRKYGDLLVSLEGGQDGSCAVRRTIVHNKNEANARLLTNPCQELPYRPLLVEYWNNNGQFTISLRHASTYATSLETVTGNAGIQRLIVKTVPLRGKHVVVNSAIDIFGQELYSAITHRYVHAATVET
jgi:hypothetical protein